MEKVLKILIVFGLMMVMIVRFMRVKEKGYRDFYFLRRVGISPGTQGILPGADGLASSGEGFSPASEAISPGSKGTLMGHMDREAPGLAKDMERQLLFVPGERSVRVLDDLSGDVRAIVRMEADPHGLVFDPVKGILYCGSMDGVMVVVKQEDMGMYTVLQTMTVPVGAVAFGVDARAGEIWVQTGEGWDIFGNA